MRGYHISPNISRSSLFEASENAKSLAFETRHFPSLVKLSHASKPFGLLSNSPECRKSGDSSGFTACCFGLSSAFLAAVECREVDLTDIQPPKVIRHERKTV